MVTGDPPPADEGGFLSRWSRLKRQQETPAPAPTAVPAESAPSVPEGDEIREAGAVVSRPDPKAEAEAKEREEVLARLPAIDSIDAGTDISGFMHRLVPDALRNAALRAAWTADPAIRDFLNDAREYALDYNTPGAAPGYGPLTESDDIQSMVSQIFGRPVDKSLAFVPEDEETINKEGCDSESQQVAGGIEQPPASSPEAPAELTAIRRTVPGVSRDELSEIPVILQDEAGEVARTAAAAVPVPVAQAADTATGLRRRGGRATPV